MCCAVSVITCPDPGTPLYGYRACTTSTHVYGSSCSFHCESGYLLNGSERLVCTNSGHWTNQLPKCESTSPVCHFFNTDILTGSSKMHWAEYILNLRRFFRFLIFLCNCTFYVLYRPYLVSYFNHHFNRDL